MCLSVFCFNGIDAECIQYTERGVCMSQTCIISQPYAIVLTAFAVIGMYFVINTVITFFYLAKCPPTVTVIARSEDEVFYKKLKHIEENIPNNYTVVYPFEGTKTEEEQQKILSEYIKNVLTVNKQ